ncbi:MAG: hypothetical protein IKI37_08435 [Oscillospiraceae bacterium]|nr:hypothetical protein [Oscillospiraceae bacterium]
MEQQYELLAAAIIERALLDYRRAKKNILKKYDVLNSEIKISEIQKFLKSKWFSLLSDLNGEKLIDLMETEEINLNEEETEESECEMQKVSCAA